jgi:alpha-L-fucosidase
LPHAAPFFIIGALKREMLRGMSRSRSPWLPGLGKIPRLCSIALFCLLLKAGETTYVPGGVSILPSDTLQQLLEKAVRAVPSERQQRWQQLEFQAFVHFGMNTFTDREWGMGTEDPKLFNPTDFDAGQWAVALKAAGVRGLIVTAKHHDGFCLWPSRFTEHSVKSSPWRGGKGDVVREVADACRKGGLKFGVYLSPWDRHEPSYGDSPRYNEHFKNQLRELLTTYGEISEVWFDGACGEGPNGKRQVYDWEGYWSLIRELQPGAVISIMGPDVRWIGNEAGICRESEWSVIPVARMDDRPDEKNPGGIAGLDAQVKDLGSLNVIEETAKRGGRLVWYPSQVDVSIRPGWFYHGAEDIKVKTLGHLLDIYYGAVGGNAQLLLNIPPDRRGRIHENDVLQLRQLGDVLRATFAVNLAANAKMSMTLAVGLADAIPNQGRRTSRSYQSDRAFEYDFGSPKTFNVAMIQEDIKGGQRVEAFAFDIWDGQAWKEIARGTTIGYKRLCRVPTVKASKVRLRILGERAPAWISNFGLFLDPTRTEAHPAITPVPAETPGLKDFVIDLGGSWRFAAVPPRLFWENGVDPASWAEVKVPGEWATQGFNLSQDVERAYKRKVSIPASFAGRLIILRFDGVYSYARVWVNGTFVRDHHGGFTSWECDVTDLVAAGEPAWITVGVTDMSDEISWGSNYAKHNIGGILRGVRLVALPEVHAARLHVETGLDAAYRNGTLKVSVTLRLREAGAADVRLSLEAPDGSELRLTPGVIRLTADEPEKAIVVPVGPVLTWDAEHPRLYRLKASVVVAGKTVEVLKKDVGFRLIEVRGNKLLVNGREVKLRGGDRHDVHPLTGRSVPPEFDELDARLFRDANINFIRTSHYPPSETFLAACDRTGIYVEEENAVCFVSTHGNYATSADPGFRDRYLGQFTEMIERDRSHPSVLLWSLGNESRWGENIKQLYNHVKAVEPSRPVIWSYPDTVPKGTSGYDVYSYHYPGFDADLKSAVIPKLNDEWAHVACYNVDTLKRDPGVRDFWGASIRKFWENAFAADGCLGGAIWGLIDDVFFLPGSTCGYGEWGIIDGWRRPKPEYWHVKKAYSPVRVVEGPMIGLTHGQPIHVPVKNWFDHTDLAELVVTWSVAARSGRMAGPKIPPRGEGMLVVPAVEAKAGDVLRLEFSRPDGTVVDEYALPVGEPAKPAWPPAGGPAPALSEDASFITVSGKDFKVVFCKSTGLIASAERGGKTLLVGGPVPYEAPSPFPPWSLMSLESRVEGDEAVVRSRGSLSGALAAYQIRIDGRGLISVDYEVLLQGRPGGASERGLSLVLPAETSSLSWKRTGLFSVYPGDHIGRNEGTALRVRPGTADTYHKPPAWSWASDMADYFLFGKDHDGYGATRDFRSLKAGIVWAEAGFAGTGARLRVEADGSKAVRAEVLPDGRVRLHVLDAWSYPDLGWGNDGGVKGFPGTLKGTLRLRLAAAPISTEEGLR